MSKGWIIGKTKSKFYKLFVFMTSADQIRWHLTNPTTFLQLLETTASRACFN